MVTNNIQSLFLDRKNFRLAWERILRSAHVDNKDRIALRVFSSDIDFHINLLIEEIQANTYTPSHAHKLYLPKSSRTLRTIPVLSMRDRIVYQALGNVLIQEALPTLSVVANRNVFAHLPQNNKSLFTLTRWEEQFSNFSKKYEQVWEEGNQWVVEADISSYYPTINHKLLIELIKERWIADELFLNLLIQCLGKWSPHEKGPELGNGLPQGYETSDVLSTLFLLPIDEKMASRYRYLRYVDDIRVLTPNQETANRALVDLDLELQTRGLILQTKKTAVLRVVDVKDEKTKLRRRFSLINILTKLGVNQKNEFKVMFFNAIRSLNKLPKNLKKRNFISFWLRLRTGVNTFLLRTINLFPWIEKTITPYITNYRLKTLFLDAWHNLNITPETSETSLAFALYRLDKDQKIGKIALELLELIPSRSGLINNYLEKFIGDQAIIDGLIKVINSHTVYSWHLANCIRTLGKISESNVYRPIASQWIRNSSLPWNQRLAAIEVLQNDQETHTLLYNQIDEEDNVIVKRSLITACIYQAQQNKSAEEVKLLLVKCFQNHNYEIRLLGIWLLRQFPEIQWGELNFQDSLGTLQPLIPEAPQNLVERPCFIKQTLRNLYNVKIKEETDLTIFFSDYNGTVVDLLKASAYFQTDPSLYVGLINSFNHRVAIELQPIIGINLPKDQFGNIIQHGKFTSTAPQISLYFKKCNDKRSQTTGFHPYASALGTWAQTVDFKEKDEIFTGLKLAYQEFINIYEKHLNP